MLRTFLTKACSDSDEDKNSDTSDSDADSDGVEIRSSSKRENGKMKA